jgi:hypothetical protein
LALDEKTLPLLFLRDDGFSSPFFSCTSSKYNLCLDEGKLLLLRDETGSSLFVSCRLSAGVLDLDERKLLLLLRGDIVSSPFVP